MPLVVPGMMTSSEGAKASDKANDEWMNKLLGKKLTDGPTDETSFSKKDLPKEHQIIGHDHADVTADHIADRLNIYLAPDGTVMKTKFD